MPKKAWRDAVTDTLTAHMRRGAHPRDMRDMANTLASVQPVDYAGQPIAVPSAPKRRTRGGKWGRRKV